MRRILCSFLIAVLFSVAPAGAEKIRVTILHLNDVYEITPLQGGRQGGLARVATLRKRLLAENPNTFTVLAGDLLSPSALGTARVDGKPLAGAQIVSVMNALGLDLATFGNHEFDLSEAQLLERLNESKFHWFSSNVVDDEGYPFSGVSELQVINVRGAGGGVLRLALIGLTINSTVKDYVRYLDPLETARQHVRQLNGKVEAVAAITHLAIEQDQQLAISIPEIAFVIGGHEHDNVQQARGDDFTPIFKADANARTVYIHRLTWDTTTRELQIESRLQPITGDIPEDPAVAQLAREWVERAYAAFRAGGFAPDDVVAVTDEELEGTEARVRNTSTNLTRLIAEALRTETEDTDVGIVHGGNIRIDDVLPAGPVTQYDVIRILPFGGKVVLVEMTGALLDRILRQGVLNRGRGSFLHVAGAEPAGDGSWLVDQKAIDPAATYRVAMPDYLMTGRDQGLEFLTAEAAGVKSVREGRDMRFAVIDEMRRRWPAERKQ